MKELVIGAGNSKARHIYDDSTGPFYSNPTYVDIDPDSKPTVQWDLNELPLPFEDEEFDEIHAYEVLEHLGKQGDWKKFFEEWNEYYRILKPKGRFYATCPATTSPWLWGDPGHTRVINNCTITFLNQKEYAEQVGKQSMTDYRHWYKGDFLPIYMDSDDDTFYFVLEKL